MFTLKMVTLSPDLYWNSKQNICLMSKMNLLYCIVTNLSKSVEVYLLYGLSAAAV